MFEYVPDTHTYWLDGEQLPSVTDLVSVFTPELEADTAEEIVAATERGTLMHDYLFQRLRGEARRGIELPAAYDAYADSVELFLAEHALEPMLLETGMFARWTSLLDYAGTPDYVGMMDGDLTLLDYKFVSAICKPKVLAQLGGYDAILNQQGIFPARLCAVQFLPDGYRLYPAEPQQARDAFLLCAKLRALRGQKFQRGSLTYVA